MTEPYQRGSFARAVAAACLFLVAAKPGAAQNATVTKAIADANEAVAGLNAFANAANMGSNQAHAVVSGNLADQSAAAAAAAADIPPASAPAA